MLKREDHKQEIEEWLKTHEITKLKPNETVIPWVDFTRDAYNKIERVLKYRVGKRAYWNFPPAVSYESLCRMYVKYGELKNVTKFEQLLIDNGLVGYRKNYPVGNRLLAAFYFPRERMLLRAARGKEDKATRAALSVIYNLDIAIFKFDATKKAECEKLIKHLRKHHFRNAVPPPPVE